LQKLLKYGNIEAYINIRKKDRKMREKSFVFAILISLLLFMTNCGGNNGYTPSPPPVPIKITGVTISPTTATVNAGETLQFSASVQPGNADQTIIYEICNYQGESCGPGKALVGTISNTGLFTPMLPGALYSNLAFKIKASAAADKTKFAISDVTITDPKLFHDQWNAVAHMISGEDQFGRSLAIEPNDDVWLAGEVKLSETMTSVSAVEVHSDGSLGGGIYYDLAPCSFRGAIITPNNTLYITGVLNNNVWLYATNTDLLHFKFQKTYSQGIGKAIAFFYDRLYIAFEQSNAVWLLTVDLDGNQIGNSVKLKDNASVSSLLFYGGNLFYSGTINDASGNPIAVYVAKITVDCQEVWTRQIEGVLALSSLHISADNNGFLYAGSTLPATTDASGKFLWIKLDAVTGLEENRKAWDGGNPVVSVTNFGNAVCTSIDGTLTAVAGQLVQIGQENPNAMDAGAIVYDSAGNEKGHTRWNLLPERSPATTIRSCVFDSQNNLILGGDIILQTSRDLLIVRFKTSQ